jgi:magnesium transporter
MTSTPPERRPSTPSRRTSQASRRSGAPSSKLSVSELRDCWAVLSPDEQREGFELLERIEQDDFFLGLDAPVQAGVLMAMPAGERKLWLRLLAPDDAADLIQEVPEVTRPSLLALLDEPTRREVLALMAYAEDAAGGLMSPRFARLRPDVTVEEAIRYLRRQAQEKLETIYYAYVLDQHQVLLGVVSFRDLFASAPEVPLADVMVRDVISVPDTMGEEDVAHVMSRHDLNAVPVVDGEGRMKGIVTIDDIVDVVRAAATEDIQKLGGMEALDTPYLHTRMRTMIGKRAGWLAALFLGEMLTASAMGVYEDEIAKAVVLALFVPLIISSGGNSGSQATTLIIRAMALGEVAIGDWWLIVRRELTAGLSLGVILATIGMVRILAWQALFHTYGEHPLQIALTVSLSLVGIVTWGTLAGAMLPFVIRRLGFDPASASAPFVATLVDVSGLVIYFNVAQLILSGTLL